MSLPIDENLFSSAPVQQLLDDLNANGHDEVDYEEPPVEDLLPPQDFKPFFVLIEDPETGEYHHPTVHYVFSDDDPEILTSAALEVLDQEEGGEDGLLAEMAEVKKRMEQRNKRDKKKTKEQKKRSRIRAAQLALGM